MSLSIGKNFALKNSLKRVVSNANKKNFFFFFQISGGASIQPTPDPKPNNTTPRHSLTQNPDNVSLLLGSSVLYQDMEVL